MYVMTKKTVLRADRVQKLRKENEWSQDDFAEKLGVNQQHVSKWEAGNNDPSAEMLIRMASVLDASVDYLLGLTEARSGVAEIRTAPELKEFLNETITPENAPEILEYVARFLKR